MNLKSYLFSFLLIFSIFLFSLVSFTQVCAQMESVDEFSEEFERTRDEAEQDFEEQKEKLDQINEDMEEEYESDMDKAQEEFEEFYQEDEEKINQKEEAFDERKEEMKKPFDIFMTRLAGILGLSAVGFGISALSNVLFFLVFIMILLLGLGGLVFDIFMIIDCLNREFEDKTVWLVVLIVGGLMGIPLLVAIVYYFVVKKKLDAIEDPEKKE